MTQTLREKVLQGNDIRKLAVTVPEWGITGYVRTWSGDGRQAMVADWIEWRDAHGGVERGAKYYRAFVVARALLDESGDRIFKDEDVPALATKSTRALDIVIAAVDRLNAVTEEAMESLIKNCDGSPSSNAGIDSQSSGAAQ